MKSLLCIFLTQALSLVACESTRLSEETQPRRGENQAVSTPAQSRTEWRAATFRGLTMGKSTRADMLKLLGKPEGVTPFVEGEQSGSRYEYKVDGEMPGVIVVVVDQRTDLVLNVELNPGGWSKEQAIKNFGNDYVVTRYGFDDCLGDGESAPLYESPDGPITRIEYRGRGIAVAVNDQDNVDYIMYVSEPVGAPSSRCKERK
jgi:hypothetical protein